MISLNCVFPNYFQKLSWIICRIISGFTFCKFNSWYIFCNSFTVFSSGTPSSTRTVLLSIIFSAFSNSASKYEQFNAACKISVALSKSSNNCCGVFCVSASRLQIIQSLPY